MSQRHPGAQRRVLVTGAAGFIGTHLVSDQAARGREVVAFDLSVSHLAERWPRPQVTLVKGDVADPEAIAEALRGVDTVFHLAATHLSVAAPPDSFRRVNVEAVAMLARLCREAGIRRLVHCSTTGVYGRLTFLPADEDSPCHPEFEYEKTKLEGERILLEEREMHDLPVTILRPGWVYGPGCRRTLKLFNAIRRRRFIVAGNGRSHRHALYIRDMVDAFELAAHAEEAVGQVCIIADDESRTIRALVDEIASLTGAPPPRSVPFGLLLGAATLTELAFRPFGREPPLSRRTLRFFSGNTSFSTDRARDVLGFRPAYTLSAGLAETFQLMERGLFFSPLPDPPRGGGPP